MTSSVMSASIARSRRQVGTVASTTSSVARLDVERLRCPRRRGSGVPAPAGAVSIPTRASSARCSSVANVVPSSRLTRAGRKATWAGGGSAGFDVDGAGRDLAAGPLGDEAGRPVGTEPREAELLALLEAEAGLGPEGVAEGRPADADRVEDGRLDDDVRRPVPDLGRRAAHDAGDADRTGRVGDEERLGVELAHDVVERLEALARRRPADDDPAVVDRGRVEGVDRLAELDHDVVARRRRRC